MIHLLNSVQDNVQHLLWVSWDKHQVSEILKYTMVFMEPEAFGKTRLRIYVRGLKPGHLQEASLFHSLLYTWDSSLSVTSSRLALKPGCSVWSWEGVLPPQSLYSLSRKNILSSQLLLRRCYKTSDSQTSPTPPYLGFISEQWLHDPHIQGTSLD